MAALLFDLDGVLWHSNQLHAMAFELVCCDFGLAMPPYHDLAGLSTWRAFEVILASNGGTRAVPIYELVRAKRRAFRRGSLDVPGEEDTIRRFFLANPHLPRGLVTGASRETADMFTRRLPRDFFEVIITADDGLSSKPSPAPYLTAAQRLRRDPDDCIALEDSKSGLESASRAGMMLAHVTGGWSGLCSTVDIPHAICAPELGQALDRIGYLSGGK